MAEILVVDDDADIRESLVDLLESEGYAVRAASDGVEALAAYEKKSIFANAVDNKGLRGIDFDP